VPNKKYIADYIAEDEVRCKCRKCVADPSRHPISLNQQQLDYFQKLSNARHIRGIPIIFVSVFRCPDHTASMRNPNSAHCQWMASDFYEQGIPIYETYRFYERVLPWNGIGINERGGTIHLDDKPGRFGRWKYKRVMRMGKFCYVPDYMILFNL